MANTSTKSAARMRLMGRESRRYGSFAMTQPQRMTVTSAALHHIGEDKPGKRKPDRPWQTVAYELVDAVGELGYLLNLKANVIADCLLQTQELNDDGDWVVVNDPAFDRVMAAFIGPQGGQRELKRRAALHLSAAGEALALNTPVPTPTGWTTMGALQAGDVIYGGDGTPCRVVHAHEVMHDRPCYEVVLTGDVRIIADENHRWLTHDYLGRVRQRNRLEARGRERDRVHTKVAEDVQPIVVTTGEMRESLTYGASGSNHAIEVSAITGTALPQPPMPDHPCGFSGCLDPEWRQGWCRNHYRDLHEHQREQRRRYGRGEWIDPYMLGYWLGDGDSQSAVITVHHDDQAHLQRQSEEAGYGWSVVASDPTGYRVRIRGLQAQLRYFGLIENKNIPAAYMRADEETRWALLQGLMDSDGHVDAQGGCEFASFRKALLLQVRELAASLGLKPGKADGRRINFASAARPVARLPRKAERIRSERVAQDEWRYVQSIDPVKSVPVRCITVDSPDSTYLITDRFVRTHNTHMLGTTSDEVGDTGILWEFLSTDELRSDAGGWTRARDGVTKENLPKDAYLARCWRSDLRWSDLASSEVKRVIPILQEIVVLTQGIDAIAKSRLAAGILFVPNEMSWAAEDSEATDTAADEGVEDDGIDEFTEVLMAHMGAPVEDRTSAAALVPLIMRGPADLADKVVLIDLARNLDAWAQDLRQEALGRLANGLDSPREMLLGKDSMNHWGSWQIDMDFLVKHVQPLGEVLAEFVTVAYARPMLEEFEEYDTATSRRRRLAFDMSPVSSKQDEGGSARSLYQLGPDVLRAETLRNANGFDDSDAPTAEEIFARQAWQLVTSAPAVFAPLINRIPGFEDVDVASLGVMGAVPGIGNGLGEVESAPMLGGGPAQLPPASGPGPGAANLLKAQLAAATEMALDRATERAATQVLGKASKLDEDTRKRLRAAPKARALQIVTPADLKQLGFTSSTLLAGAWDSLNQLTRGLIRHHLETFGLDPLAADEKAAETASVLCNQIGVWTAEHLCSDVRQRRDGLRVPARIIDLVVEDLLAATMETV